MIALPCVVSCSGDNHITRQPPDDSVQVHGTLLGRTCPRPYFYPPPPRFSTITGETATVFFLDTNGVVASVETNDSSNFEMKVKPGSYRIAVKTAYNYPPDTTYDVRLHSGDTVLTLETFLSVLDPEMFIFEFDRYVMVDTPSVDEEWAIVNELNRQTQIISGKEIPAFDISETTLSEERRIIGSFVVYELPIIREDPIYGELYNVVEVEIMLSDFLAKDTIGLAPFGFYILPSGGYACRF